MSRLTLDDREFGAIGGVVRQQTPQAAAGAGQVVVRVLGGASELTIGANDR